MKRIFALWLLVLLFLATPTSIVRGANNTVITPMGSGAGLVAADLGSGAGPNPSPDSIAGATSESTVGGSAKSANGLAGQTDKSPPIMGETTGDQDTSSTRTANPDITVSGPLVSPSRATPETSTPDSLAPVVKGGEPPASPKSQPDGVLVAEYTTPLIHSPANRNHNISLALKRLEGYLIKPGEVFSFNQVVGPRTHERGFKTAMIIKDRKFVPGIGGGVCQVASTLYNVVLSAGLKVVERYPHSLKISYVPPGKDAAVSYGVQDLKFINNRNVPLIIRTRVGKQQVKIAFYRPDDLPTAQVPGKQSTIAARVRSNN